MNEPIWTPACPTPLSADHGRVLLAHGEGGRLMRRLIREHILPQYRNDYLAVLGDAAVLPRLNGAPVLTTDSFVVSPLFFPGGDIGTLAVYGTINDLAVAGARPLWLTLSLIIEEGFALEMLDRVLASVRAAADRAGVSVVTGDTKVVPHGTADGMFINTTGLGELVLPAPAGPAALQPGDELIVSGAIGRHGVAVLAAREMLAIEPAPASDCAPLVEAVDALRCGSVIVRAMRDATRGGVAAVLHEWAAACGHSLVIEESQVPVSPDVRGVCELLGLDPLHVANEGTMLVAVPAGHAAAAVAALRSVALSTHAARIGHVVSRTIAPVTVKRILGREQPLDEPLGAPLPRIC